MPRVKRPVSRDESCIGRSSRTHAMGIEQIHKGRAVMEILYGRTLPCTTATMPRSPQGTEAATGIGNRRQSAIDERQSHARIFLSKLSIVNPALRFDDHPTAWISGRGLDFLGDGAREARGRPKNHSRQAWFRPATNFFLQ